MDRMDAVSEQEFRRAIECEARCDILEVDGDTKLEAVLHACEDGVCVRVEGLKVADTVASEEGAGERAVELP